MARAIALLSGGLDSTLAVLLLRRQGIEVTGVTFMTHFGCDMRDGASCSSDSSSNAARWGFEVRMSHLADKFIEVVKHPKFGHGKNMNPCIDCRILMLKEAHLLMRMTGADFISTGEVLGQRPMSQRHDTFPVMDREAGVEGLVLRPLCAKLLKPTKPEIDGLVNREMLCDFSGRSRKPQMALAAEFGLTEYPAPAGGCLLTDPCYSHRLREALAHTPDIGPHELNLMRLGRHFRLPSGVKVIVGRNESENDQIEALAMAGDSVLYVESAGSPMVLIGAGASEDDINTAAALCARYSDAKSQPAVTVTVRLGSVERAMDVAPAEEVSVRQLMVTQP